MADVSQDKDFLAAPREQQIAYLKTTDPDFASASPEDQEAYRQHITGGPVAETQAITGPAVAPTPKPGALGDSPLTRGTYPQSHPSQAESIGNKIHNKDYGGAVTETLSDLSANATPLMLAGGMGGVASEGLKKTGLRVGGSLLGAGAGAVTAREGAKVLGAPEGVSDAAGAVGGLVGGIAGGYLPGHISSVSPELPMPGTRGAIKVRTPEWLRDSANPEPQSSKIPLRMPKSQQTGTGGFPATEPPSVGTKISSPAGKSGLIVSPDAPPPHVEGSYWSFNEGALRKAVMTGDRDAATVYKQRFGNLPPNAGLLTDVGSKPNRGLYRSQK